MRTNAAKQVHYDGGPNMTPLVDVVMVILIFLMLAGSFGAAEHYLASDVPVRTGGRVDSRPLPADTDFRIVVDTAGDRLITRPDGMDPTSDAAMLQTALSIKLAEFTAAGTPIDKVQVIISPGRQVRYDDLVGVYEAALAANGPNHEKFTKVAFDTPHD